MSSPIRGQHNIDLTPWIQDRLAPVEVVTATHSFSEPTKVVTALGVGDVVIKTWFEVKTAYNAATTNVVTAGNGANASKFLGAADITEGTPGVYPATDNLPPGTAETAASNLTITYSQTGTAATAGAGQFYATIARAAVLDADTNF